MIGFEKNALGSKQNYGKRRAIRMIEPATLITAIVAIVAAIFGSTGFWQWMSDRSKGGIRVSLQELRNEIEKMKVSEDEREAKNSRRRILRFNDELLRDVDHSKEYFDDILTDIDSYEAYCEAHHGFQNGKAVMAIENIRRCYRLCTEKNNFL